MIGRGSPLLVQAIHLFHAAPRDVVVLRAKHLIGQCGLVATAAKIIGKDRLHPLRVILLLISAARLDHAIQTEPSSLDRRLPTLYTQPRASATILLRLFLLLDSPPPLLVQRVPVLLVSCSAFCSTLRAERLVRFCVLFAAFRADMMRFSPMVCFPFIRAAVCTFVKAHRPSPHRINSGVDGRAIPLDLLRCESPAPIGVTKNLDKLLHACCLCHKTTSSYCASISTHLHILA